MPQASATLFESVRTGDLATAKACLGRGECPDGRAPSGLSLLMIAAGRGDAEMTRLLLDAGADVFSLDVHAARRHSTRPVRGAASMSRMLLDAGAFIDVQTATTGHTPLIEALWYKRPEIVNLLLDRGAGLDINTHYGFTLQEHLAYALKVNTIGRELLVEAEGDVRRREQSDQDSVKSQALMAAVTTGDLQSVRRLLADGAAVDERSPILNGFNDGHTPLLVASRDGHTEIVAALLEAGADVNAVEPTFLAVPLHKAVYNGHADITQLLVRNRGSISTSRVRRTATRRSTTRSGTASRIAPSR